MINVARSTKTYSSAPQEPQFQKDTRQFVGAGEQKKHFDDKDVGQVLNEIADPNYQPPKARQGVGDSEMGKDAFFKLMLAQIKHQDPTNPLQSHEMASQLAQFTSLEQLFNINEGLQGLKKVQEPTSNFQALNFIGKRVVADASRIQRQPGDKVHDVSYRLPANAQEIKIQITDKSGKDVRNIKLAALKEGEHKFTWNGIQDNGEAARAGDYRFSVSAVGEDGKKLSIQNRVEGTVTGINYSKEGPLLLVGDQAVRLTDISRLEDASLKESTQTAKQVSTQPPSAVNAAEGSIDSSSLNVPGAPPEIEGELGPIIEEGGNNG